MRSVAAWIALCALVGSLAACGRHDGRLLVVVGTDYNVPPVSCLRARFSQDGDDAGSMRTTRIFPLRGQGTAAEAGIYTIPLSFVVRPKDGDSHRRVRIDLSLHATCDAARSSEEGIHTHRVVRGFVPNETRVVPVHISRACEMIAGCETYCEYGRCAPTEVLDPESLPVARRPNNEQATLYHPVVTVFEGASQAAIVGHPVPSEQYIFYALPNGDPTTPTGRIDILSGSSSLINLNATVRALAARPLSADPVWASLSTLLDGRSLSQHNSEGVPTGDPVAFTSTVSLGGPSSLAIGTNSWVAAIEGGYAVGDLTVTSTSCVFDTGRTSNDLLDNAGAGVWAGIAERVVPGSDPPAYIPTVVTLHNPPAGARALVLSQRTAGAAATGCVPTDPMAPGNWSWFTIPSGSNTLTATDASLDFAQTGVWIVASYAEASRAHGVLFHAALDGSSNLDQPLGGDTSMVPTVIELARAPTLTGDRLVIGGRYSGSDVSAWGAALEVDATVSPPAGAWFLTVDCTYDSAIRCTPVPGTGLTIAATTPDAAAPEVLSLTMVRYQPYAAVRVSSAVRFHGERGTHYESWGGSGNPNDVLIVRLPPIPYPPRDLDAGADGGP